MERISEFLLGPQPSAGSTSAVVLAVIAVVLAVALMAYLLRCYVQEALLCKRVKRLVSTRSNNGVPSPPVLSQTKRLRAKSSAVLPSPHRNGTPLKLRRRSRHPWKHNRFGTDSPTPH